jgi:hypothetical protein
VVADLLQVEKGLDVRFICAELIESIQTPKHMNKEEDYIRVQRTNLRGKCLVGSACSGFPSMLGGTKAIYSVWLSACVSWAMGVELLVMD